jgi:ZIP family zinc transporter
MLGPMAEAFFWGFVGAAFLIVGAILAFAVDLPVRIRGLILAFGAGALFGAVAYDLVEEAIATSTASYAVGAGFALGAVVFYVGSRAVERMDAHGGTAATEPAASDAPPRMGSRRDPRTDGLAVLLGSILDGIPESIVLGASLLAGAGVSVPILVAIAISNVPEGLSASEDLTRPGGFTRRQVLGVWTAVALASGIAAAVGYVALADAAPDVVAFVDAFAAGAILALLAETMIPEAHEIGGRATGLATCFGFAVSAALSFNT